MEVRAEVQSVTDRAQTLAARVNEHIHATGSSIAMIAKTISYSRTTLSRYLAGKYDSDPADLEAHLLDYLATQGGELLLLPTRAANPKRGAKPDFFESRDAKSILGVCQSCQDYLGLGIVVGRSGFGKTHALRHYAKLPRVAYIECDDTMAARDLVTAIERSLGLPSSYGSIWMRVNSIRDFFKANRGYLLIIDEADKLISKYTQKKMEILRTIFDQSDLGLVLAGEPKLEALLASYIPRLENRVDFCARLQGLSPSEVEAYLSDLDISPEALLELKARAGHSRKGCFRLLDRTLANVRRILQQGESGQINAKTIEQASGMMLL